METVKVKCPYCGSEEVSLYGKSSTGAQRYLCRNEVYKHKTFQLEYKNNASKPGVKEKIVEMVINGSGIRDTGRVLGHLRMIFCAKWQNFWFRFIRVRSFKGYGDSRFKKTKKFAKSINEKYLLEQRSKKQIDIVIHNVLASENDELSIEMGEMWSYYHDKRHQLWLWWAVDHETNRPLAYVF